MRDLFQAKTNAQVELVKSGGGVFEVTVDGELAYSKKSTGRFPDESELEPFLRG